MRRCYSAIEMTHKENFNSYNYIVFKFWQPINIEMENPPQQVTDLTVHVCSFYPLFHKSMHEPMIMR